MLILRTFDSWIGLVKTKKMYVDINKKVKKLQARRFFQLWKQELSLKQMGAVAYKTYERKLKRRAMEAWIEVRKVYLDNISLSR